MIEVNELEYDYCHIVCEDDASLSMIEVTEMLMEVMPHTELAQDGWIPRKVTRNKGELIVNFYRKKNHLKK